MTPISDLIVHDLVAMGEDVPEADDPRDVRDLRGQLRNLAAEPVQRLTHDLELALDARSDQFVGAEAIEVEATPEPLDRSCGVEDIRQERS